MRYEEPIMKLIEFEKVDIITLSDGKDFVKDTAEDGRWI